MGILQGLFRSRDKPQNRTAGSGYSFFFGGTTSGKAVTERSAMQMTAVYACVRILSEAIAGLPLHLYRYKENGGKEKAVEHPLYLLLHDEPNPEMSSFVFPPVFVFILLYHILHICVYFFSIAPLPAQRFMPKNMSNSQTDMQRRKISLIKRRRKLQTEIRGKI